VVEEDVCTLCLSHGRINNLKDADGECGCLSSAGLCLGNRVTAFAYLDDGSRLDCRGGFVSVCIDSTKKVFYLKVSIALFSSKGKWFVPFKCMSSTNRALLAGVFRHSWDSYRSAHYE
jgi:hypothetical protein